MCIPQIRDDMCRHVDNGNSPYIHCHTDPVDKDGHNVLQSIQTHTGISPCSRHIWPHEDIDICSHSSHPSTQEDTLYIHSFIQQHIPKRPHCIHTCPLNFASIEVFLGKRKKLNWCKLQFFKIDFRRFMLASNIISSKTEPCFIQNLETYGCCSQDHRIHLDIHTYQAKHKPQICMKGCKRAYSCHFPSLCNQDSMQE